MNMNRNKEDLITILKVCAAGINEALIGYYASVDLSGKTPQLVIH